jgi:hypothetical protein
MMKLTRHLYSWMADPVAPPDIVADKNHPAAWIERVPGEPLTFSAPPDNRRTCR